MNTDNIKCPICHKKDKLVFGFDKWDKNPTGACLRCGHWFNLVNKNRNGLLPIMPESVFGEGKVLSVEQIPSRKDIYYRTLASEILTYKEYYDVYQECPKK